MYKVGKSYRVTTVRLGERVLDRRSGNSWTLVNWHGFTGHLPLLMPFGADEPFLVTVGFTYHAHIHWQFVPQPFYDHCKALFNVDNGTMHQQVITMDAQYMPTMPRLLASRRLPCLRPAAVAPNMDIAYWLPQLERKYACAALTAGKCPHKGTPRDAMVEVDGLLVCPTHGLRWKKRGGQLAPRSRCVSKS